MEYDSTSTSKKCCFIAKAFELKNDKQNLVDV